MRYLALAAGIVLLAAAPAHSGAGGMVQPPTQDQSLRQTPATIRGNDRIGRCGGVLQGLSERTEIEPKRRAMLRRDAEGFAELYYNGKLFDPGDLNEPLPLEANPPNPYADAVKRLIDSQATAAARESAIQSLLQQAQGCSQYIARQQEKRDLLRVQP